MCGGFVPRLKRTGDAELRQYLLAWTVELRDMYGDKLSEASVVYSNRINALTRGEAYRLHAWELPDNHPVRLTYGINADLVLTEDDVLVPHDIRN
jgi:hypothetical protein